MRADTWTWFDLPERELLDVYLDYHRATLLWKLEGLDDEQLRRRLLPSATSLLGLVKHLTNVERWWFTVVFRGEGERSPREQADPDWDFRVEPDETTEQILQGYRDECDRSRRAIVGASLDEAARRDHPKPSLRWILTHMIEETARHNGHADVVRELIDGVTGD